MSCGYRALRSASPYSRQIAFVVAAPSSHAPDKRGKTDGGGGGRVGASQCTKRPEGQKRNGREEQTLMEEGIINID